LDLTPDLFLIIPCIGMVLLNNGAAAIAKIFAGTKTTNLTIVNVQLDTTAGTINASDSGAATPTTPNPVTGGILSQATNVMTVSHTITPANNQGLWRRWWLHFRTDLTEGVAGGSFTDPGINHDGSGTDVVEFDVIIVEG